MFTLGSAGYKHAVASACARPFQAAVDDLAGSFFGDAQSVAHGLERRLVVAARANDAVVNLNRSPLSLVAAPIDDRPFRRRPPGPH